jgi:predicted unusual protein kinase regulating ubiquinone biosynthesis (AarF/ABC1/UbiB family)
MRGLPQKLGQILSLSQGQADVFETLCETPAVLDQQEVEAILNHYFHPWQDTFSSFDFNGSGASLGQVHCATIAQSKHRVAVKVQYPFIAAALEADIAALGMLSTPLAKKKGFAVDSYKEAFRSSLLRELDYREELSSLSRFYDRLKEDPLIVIPCPYPQLCTEEILVMDWIEGEPLSKAKDLEFADRFQLARSLLRFFLSGWLEWNEIHTDPHSGNYRILQRDGITKLGVLDFGCTYRITEQESILIKSLISSGTTYSNAELFNLFTSLGWDADLLEPLTPYLQEVTSVLLMPFSGGPFNTREWQLSSRIEEIVGDLRWNFRFAGPASLMLFIRGLTGLISNLNMLGVPLNWGLELSHILHASPPPNLSTQKVPVVKRAASTAASQKLYLEVKRNGELKARICLPSTAVKRLQEFIPEDIATKLSSQNIDTERIARDALLNNLPPGELFFLDEEERTVRVWLSA